MPPNVTAIIPAFNEEARISHVIQGVVSLVDEVIVVNDGSRDDTARIAKSAGAMVVSLPQNQGYIAALKAGFKAASGDIVVTLDADGEFSPGYIPLLVAPVAAGAAEMTQGHRGLVPRPSERFLTWLASRKRAVGDSGTGLRAIKTDLAKSLRIEGACICGVLSLEVIKRGGRIVEVPIELVSVDKPRKIAWFHLRQLFYLLPWLWKKI
jgi:glycosyltransferase involved in cell wall biosynthesis